MRKKIMHFPSSKFIRIIGAWLIFYLLLFSAFAFFHAYANNELIDADGCQIGQWLQQGQGTLFSLLLIFMTIGFVFTHFWPLRPFPGQVVPLSLPARVLRFSCRNGMSRFLTQSMQRDAAVIQG